MSTLWYKAFRSVAGVTRMSGASFKTPLGAVRGVVSKIPNRSLTRIGINAALNSTRRAGIDITKRDFTKIVNAEKRSRKAIAKQNLLGDDDIIPKSAMHVPPMKLSKDYLYQFSLNVWSYETGEYEDKTFQLSSNSQLTKLEAKQEFFSSFEDRFDQADVDWSNLKFIQAFRRGRDI
tara:strand:- start:2756 stop:3286 length:531 start_codon:yes stop_codon:yes gene_type:complete